MTKEWVAATYFGPPELTFALVPRDDGGRSRSGGFAAHLVALVGHQGAYGPQDSGRQRLYCNRPTHQRQITSTYDYAIRCCLACCVMACFDVSD